MLSSRRPAALLALACFALLAPAACSASSSGAASASKTSDAGEGGTAAGPDGGGGDDGSATGGDSGGGGEGRTEGGSDAGPLPPGAQCPTKPVPADFGGVDLSHPPTAAVQGCSRGLDTTTGSLSFILAASAPAVVDTYQGAIRANGSACAAPDGTPATVTNVTKIIVKGSAGNDSLVIDLAAAEYSAKFLGTAGAFSIDLGGGSDTVSIRGTECSDAYTAAAGTGGTTTVDVGAGTSTMQMSNVEGLVVSLGSSDDTFSADGASPAKLPLTIFGDSGNDALRGGAGDDILNGDADDDTFDQGSGANGADTINGGDGHDTITYTSRTSGVTITLCPATQTDGCIPGTANCPCTAVGGETGEHDVVANVEDATGGTGNDVITGDAQANTLDGNAGDDVIDGQAGDDTIYGDQGSDTMIGGDGDDLISGGPGAESIDGQAGANICLCGAKPKAIKNCQIMSGC